MAKYRVDTDNGSYLVETADAPPVDALTGALPIPNAAKDLRSLAPVGLRGVSPQDLAAGLDPTRLNPNSGVTYGDYGHAGTMESGVSQIGAGVAQMAQPNLRDTAGGLHKVIGGAMQVAAPLLPEAAVAAPLATGAGLTLGTLAQKGVTSGLKAAGTPDEYADLAGDVAGIAGGGAAAHYAPGAAGTVADTVGNARLLPRSGTPVQRAAVDWALRQGAPLDAGAATLNPVVRGTQEIAKSTLGAGSSAEAAIQARNQWYADKGRQLAEQVSPVPQTPETAGRAINEQGIQTIQRQNAGANDAYAELRSYELDPKNSREVQTGTKQETRQMSGVVDAAGNPTSQSVTRQVPVIENVAMPVDMRPFKDRFAPVLEDIQRQTRLGQSQYAPAQIALEDLVNGPDFKPAGVAEKDLGALKRVSDNNTLTGGVKNDAGGLAAQSIPELQKSIDSAVETAAGPDALKALRTGRLNTAGKYAAIDLVDQFKTEPVKLFQQLTTAKDGGVDLLKQVQKLAPEQTPALGRAWLDGALNQATESGGFSHSDKLFADWQKLGPETKKILFKTPAMVSDLDNFFQSAKDSGRVENTSGTAKVSHLAAQGNALALSVFNPLHVSVPTGAYLIAGNVVSRLLYNPRFVRAAIRAMKTDAGSAGAAAAASDLVKAAGPGAVPLSRGADAGLSAETSGPASRQQSQALPGTAGTSGGAGAGAPGGRGSADTTVEIPGSTAGGYQAQYKLRELADVEASHSGLTFQPNPKYAARNDRDYTSDILTSN